MFEKFPPPIGGTIEDFFNEPFFGQTDDDLALDPANELELQHPDLSVADCERLAREAVEERSAASRAARWPTSSIPAQAFARLELGLGSSSFIPLAPQAVAALREQRFNQDDLVHEHLRRRSQLLNSFGIWNPRPTWPAIQDKH